MLTNGVNAVEMTGLGGGGGGTQANEEGDY